MSKNKRSLKNLIIKPSNFFTFERVYKMLHEGDPVVYMNCELLIDFGPLQKGYKCAVVSIKTNETFMMNIDGYFFVPVWTCETIQNKPINLVWCIDDIFTYSERYCCNDNVEFSDCELLLDLAPFKKGTKCAAISIAAGGEFTMCINDCDDKTPDGSFVPVWTYLDETYLAKTVKTFYYLEIDNKEFMEKLIIIQELFAVNDIAKIVLNLFLYISQPTFQSETLLMFPFLTL